MKPRQPVPPREAATSVALLVLLAAAVVFAPVVPGPGPLALCAAVAAAHAALLAPAIGRGGAGWAFFPALLALPALLAMSFGHDATSLAGALLIVLLACAGGWSGRTLDRRAGAAFYLPSMLLVFFAPYALDYLVREFAGGAHADAWLALSPLAAATAGGWPGPGCILLLLAWPVWTVARRAK